MTQSQTTGRDVSDLVRAAQGGDKDALDDLVAEHLPLIYNIVGRALGGHPDVDDLVQDTMVRAISALTDLRDPDRFRSWLVTIAYRQIHLHLRARMNSRRRQAPAPLEVPDPLGDFAERTTAELVAANQRRELVEATRWLDDADRRLLGLWWQEAAGELSRGELAAALEVKPKHAAVRVQRMKAHLDAARGIVRAIRARPRCPELADQLGRWNGVADPLWRKRLVRHIRDCPQCGPRGQGLFAPEELLLGMATLPVPIGLAAGVKAALPVKAGLSTGASVLAQVQGFLQHKSLAVATAATVAAGGGLAYAVHYSELPPETGQAIVLPTASARSTTTPAPAKPSQRSSPAPRTSTGAAVAKADIYVAPGGSDDGDGSAGKPYASLNKAVAKVRPGQTIALRGGTYRLTEPITITTDGTATKRIVLTGYGTERPVLDAAALPATQWAITQQSSFWTVQGLEVINSRSHPYVCRACRQNIFRRLSMHDNARSGLLLRDPGTTGNQVLDSDFFANRDPGGAAGIGLGIGFGAGEGNLLRGNRAYGNAAAGFDLGSFTSPVTVEYNWAYRNGGSGFVLGGGTPPASAAHRLRHDAAWDNAGNGFADDGNTAALELSNNTAFRNRGTGFSLPDAAATTRSNVAIDNAEAVSLSASAKESRNSWQQQGVTAAVFRSTDSSAAEGQRAGGGRLPSTDFLTTGNGTGASMAGT